MLNNDFCFLSLILISFLISETSSGFKPGVTEISTTEDFNSKFFQKKFAFDKNLFYF